MVFIDQSSRNRNQSNNNVISYPYVDYIIKSYVPQLQLNKISRKVNMNLFRMATTHLSAIKSDSTESYERLEYLGDAVFHMIVTDYFYRRYDEQGEGFITRLRIRIERGDSMAELTRILKLDSYIIAHGIALNEHILEDVFEAFIGAFFLNFGIGYTRAFVIKLIESHKDLSELISHDDNYKDLLLRFFHQKKWSHPIYEARALNDNADSRSQSKRFACSVSDPTGRILGTGCSNSKKKSEQDASKYALIKLGVIVNGEIDQGWINKIDRAIQTKIKAKPDKQSMTIHNPSNVLMTSKDIRLILANYNTAVPQGTKINSRLFYEAMTHKSYTKRKKLSDTDKLMTKTCVKLQEKSNERLQLVGDSVIHFVIGEHLFHTYPKADEGFMTRLRCKLENRETLCDLAIRCEINQFVLVSQNIEVLHGRTNVNIISGGFEAFVGALYLQFGLRVTKQFVCEVLRIELNISEIAENETNYKDLILQLYNQNGWGRPIYQVIEEEGPDHRKFFTMGIYLNGKLMGTGKASSKKKAEQIASKEMYCNRK